MPSAKSTTLLVLLCCITLTGPVRAQEPAPAHDAARDDTHTETRSEPLRHVPDPRLPPDSSLLPESVRTPPSQPLVPPPRPKMSRWTKYSGGLPAAELAVLGTVVAIDLVMFGLRDTFDQIQGRPRIEDPGPNDLDTRISNALYTPGAPMLHGSFPNYLGSVIAPTLGLAFYGTNAIVYWIRGRSLVNPASDERDYPAQPARLLWAACEVAAYSTFFQQIANSAIERDRPSLGLKRPDHTPGGGGQDHMSFYSGHVSTAFAIAAFISLNVGDFLSQQPLRNMHPAPRFLIARVLPTLTLYGLATYVGISRLYDQIHYFSDVALGAVIGTAIGNIVYLTHFGSPSQAGLRQGRLVPMGPGGIGYVRSF
jgi:membrane-associated phospholipid phosphatase